MEPPPRRWTKVRVIAAIQDRYIAGQPVHIEGLGDLRLANAAKRRFGSWEVAVEAAGLAGRITIKKPLRRWSQELVIEEIRNWHQGGRPLEDWRTGGRQQGEPGAVLRRENLVRYLASSFEGRGIPILSTNLDQASDRRRDP